MKCKKNVFSLVSRRWKASNVVIAVEILAIKPQIKFGHFYSSTGKVNKYVKRYDLHEKVFRSL